MKKRLLILLFVLLSVVALMTGALTFAGAAEAPAASINYFTLSLENAVYIQYAVDYSGFTPDTGNIGMLFWTAEPADPVKGTEEATASVVGTETIEGKKLYIFKYTELSARQMCDTVWARAYALVDGTYYYSDVESYSVVTYAAHKLGLVEGVEGTQDESLKILLRQMLAYGEAAQKHFGYHPEVLPTDILPENRFTVTFNTVGGSEIPAQTVCRDRRVTEPEAPIKEGDTFIGWFNGETAWNFETDTVTENITLTARWQGSVRYSEGLAFTSNGDGTCGVSGIGTCTDTEINIPPVSPDGDRVISVCADAFWSRSRLTSITIPDSVASIGESAFSGCSSLTSITISDSVTSIGEKAFSGCSGLTSITVGENNTVYHSTGNCLIETATQTLIAGCKKSVIPADGSVTSIGGYAFYECSGLTSITIPDSVTCISGSAFYGCSSLTSITIPFVGNQKDGTSNTHFGYIFGASSYGNNSNCIPSTLKTVVITGGASIGNNAFYYCSGLTSITVPDSVTGIGVCAFYHCSGLTSITIGNDVTSIGTSAFYGCSRLTSITIPDSVTSIGDSAFRDCSSLTSITIPDSVVRIADHAFDGCSSLTSITIPDSVESIADYMFYGCSSLTSITIPDSVVSIGTYMFYGCSSLTSITIPDSVVSIADYMFYGCSSLTSITIPDSVTSIDICAFYGCSSLTSITIPDSVTSIRSTAFQRCSNLASITIPDSVTYIAYHVFYDCSSLTSITIPDSVELIESYAFYGCSSLTNITIPDRVWSIGNYAFDGCSGLTNITIPDSVTRIGMGAFKGCSNLTSLTIPFVGNVKDGTSNTHFGYIFGASSYSENSKYIPSTLKTVAITGETRLGDYAFFGCSGLTSITIPDSVTGIGEYAFYYCRGLTSITIPDGVTSIGKYAFKGCSNLTSITVPGSVTSLGDQTFYNCSSLTDITFAGTMAEWNAITKGSDWNTGTGAYTVHCKDGDLSKT